MLCTEATRVCRKGWGGVGWGGGGGDILEFGGDITRLGEDEGEEGGGYRAAS